MTTRLTGKREPFATRTAEPTRAIETTAACDGRWPNGFRWCISMRWNPAGYVAAYPVFVVEDHPAQLRFSLQVDDIHTAEQTSFDGLAVSEDPEPRRAYVTATFQRRLHQVAFRQRVIRAYAERCALCRLRHQELLDAAHITPDSDLEGEPVVSNGVALCKLHHAAFDRFFFAIRPDYVIEVRESILRRNRMAQCSSWACSRSMAS